MHNSNWVFAHPNHSAKPLSIESPKNERQENGKSKRQIVKEDRKANRKYFEDNERMICRAYEKKYITVHRAGLGRIVTANETEEARANYLKTKLDSLTRKGAYIHKGRLGEFTADDFDFAI